MTEADKEKLIRQYAADEITWRELRDRGDETLREIARSYNVSHSTIPRLVG